MVNLLISVQVCVSITLMPEQAIALWVRVFAEDLFARDMYSAADALGSPLNLFRNRGLQIARIRTNHSRNLASIVLIKPIQFNPISVLILRDDQIAAEYLLSPIR